MPSRSSRMGKRQQLISAALGTVFWDILWNKISDWTHDSTAWDAIEKLQQDMDTLSNYISVFEEKIKTRFDKDFLIQAAIAELGLHITSYDAATWRPTYPAIAHR